MYTLFTGCLGHSHCDPYRRWQAYYLVKSMFSQIIFSDILVTSICKLCVSIGLPGEICGRESVKYVNDTAINSRLRLVCQLQIVESQPVVWVSLHPIYCGLWCRSILMKSYFAE